MKPGKIKGNSQRRLNNISFDTKHSQGLLAPSRVIGNILSCIMWTVLQILKTPSRGKVYMIQTVAMTQATANFLNWPQVMETS